jgi:hypothetical protein
MANEPAQSLAEQSATAASSRGVGYSSRNSATGFAERILRRPAGSYASGVHPIKARLTVSRAPAERR